MARKLSKSQFAVVAALMRTNGTIQQEHDRYSWRSSLCVSMMNPPRMSTATFRSLLTMKAIELVDARIQERAVGRLDERGEMVWTDRKICVYRVSNFGTICYSHTSRNHEATDPLTPPAA